MTTTQEGGDLAASVLNAAAKLSEEADEHALAEALLAAVMPLADAGGLRLLGLKNEVADTEFDATNADTAQTVDLFDGGGASTPLIQDPELAECVRTERLVSAEQAGGLRRLVIPVPGSRRVIQLLVLDDLRELKLAESMLEVLVRIYGNQLLHVMRNERDPLTGLYNRQSFGNRLKQATASVSGPRRRWRDPSTSSHCFALFDIDHFKQVNDRYGHVYGDEVLILLARLMVRSFRSYDMLFRYGGEEFGALLPDLDSQTVVPVLERFRGVVEAFDFPRIGHKTVSIGVTQIAPNDIVQNIVARADKALYYAKEHGRNRVCSYEALLESGDLAPAKIAVGDVELF